MTGPLRVTTMAEVYQGDGPQGPVTLHVVHAELARNAAVRDAILAGAKRAAGAGEHNHLVATLSAGVDGELLWVLTGPLEGSTVRDLLTRKRQGGGGGFGARGAGNLVIGVASGLGDGGVHGGLSTDSVVVNRNGRVRVCDLALGGGHAAAVAAGLLPGGSHVAPEVAKGAVPTREADVYGLGALLYEALVGKPLERGGPRPSEVVGGLTPTIDELIARMCASAPDRRFGSVEVVKEVVGDALARGAAFEDDKRTTPPPGSGELRRPSLAQSIAQPQASARMAAQPDPRSSGSNLAITAAADPALTAALADTTEHWLVAKGRLDYGPFSLKDIVEQINKGDIVAGNIVIDKDTGARSQVDQHPLLGPMVDAARQRLDDARRAHAEVHHQSKEKKRGALLYAMIGLAVAVLGLVIYLIVANLGGAKKGDDVVGVDKVGGASLSVTFSQPKKPAPQKRTGGGGGSRGGGSRGGGGNNGDDADQMLDLSGDDDSGSATLDMGTIYNVYSRYGGQLGSCMNKAGESYVLIAIIIDGPTGKVTYVRANGQKSGKLADCIGRVMRTMKFPPVDGTRTRAEFDISL